MPGVRSSSSCTRSGSMARRAAWRYSSYRCADTAAPVPATIAAAISSAVTLLAREPGAIVVGRIAINGVDVIDAALLRCVLDDQGRSLDAEVCRTAVGRRTATGKVRVG